ncbi:hypothetical protein [Erythrobacter sp. THAF29]|uniref:hypothetical protein n=1 Tax=Erythrobacter sp. THAF29 TaxID=2587851 RepID=UPI001268D19C|nr:hypothetical protein [Erythrobacter sp. THAF29]QFT77367.1 hypothetical protein FIU90_07405 [Erythrobacter sp. THAF29]
METNRRNETGSEKTRCLAQVETDLVKAEDAFADADARLKAARADRAAAIELINGHQREMDALIADMRRRSVPGTKWHPEGAVEAETLELGKDSMVPDDTRDTQLEGSLVSREKKEEVSRKFARLNGKSPPEGDDPVLKVVYGPDE